MAKSSKASYEKLCEYERSVSVADSQIEKSVVSAAEDKSDLVYEVKKGKLVKSKNKAVSADPSTQRVRCFRLVSYIPVPSLDMFLRDQEWIQHWAYCHHDKDRCKGSDGNIALKKAHTHILLYTFNPKSSRAMSKIFDRYSQTLCAEGEQLEKTLCQPCDDIVRWCRYLLHDDECDPLYHHYMPAERICDDDNYWRKLEKTQGMNESDGNKAYNIAMEYISGASYHDLLLRHGHYFMANVNRIRDIANHICIEKGWPVPMCRHNQESTLGDDMIKCFLECSKFTPLEQANFYMVWNYIQSQCFAHYGQAVDFYLTERN